MESAYPGWMHVYMIRTMAKPKWQFILGVKSR